MDNSITNFELSESTVKIDSKPSSERSDNFEELDDLSSNESNEKKSEDDFDNNLPETVTILTEPDTGAKVYLVGTAHFSQESKDDVAKVIRAVQPHIVILELCDSRTGILSLDEKTILEEAKNINIDNIIYTIKKNGTYYGITYLLLLNLSAHLTKEIGMAPGGEFRVAFKEASQIPYCTVQLGDRPIKITLLRALSKLTWWQTIKLAWNLLFSKEHISKEEVEKCKRKDMLEQLLADMSGEFPVVGEVFVDERDIYLTYVLQQAAKMDLNRINGISPNDNILRVVGVVGIGHMLGIQRLFPVDQSPFIPNILVIPPPSLTSRVIKVAFKISMLTLGGYLVYRYLPLPRTVRTTCHHALEKIITNIRQR